MRKLKFDSGVEEYSLPGGVLRFNPRDPNLYSRFLQAAEDITAMEQELTEKAKALIPGDGAQAVSLMVEADSRIKALLQQVFGEQNDFQTLLGGVNLLAVGSNGERVITNLFEALMPILTEGAESCAREKVENARQAAKNRRAQQ